MDGMVDEPDCVANKRGETNTLLHITATDKVETIWVFMMVVGFGVRIR
jgi:hypothetical protein